MLPHSSLLKLQLRRFFYVLLKSLTYGAPPLCEDSNPLLLFALHSIYRPHAAFLLSFFSSVAFRLVTACCYPSPVFCLIAFSFSPPFSFLFSLVFFFFVFPIYLSLVFFSSLPLTCHFPLPSASIIYIINVIKIFPFVHYLLTIMFLTRGKLTYKA